MALENCLIRSEEESLLRGVCGLEFFTRLLADDGWNNFDAARIVIEIENEIEILLNKAQNYVQIAKSPITIVCIPVRHASVDLQRYIPNHPNLPHTTSSIAASSREFKVGATKKKMVYAAICHLRQPAPKPSPHCRTIHSFKALICASVSYHDANC